MQYILSRLQPCAYGWAFSKFRPLKPCLEIPNELQSKLLEGGVLHRGLCRGRITVGVIKRYARTLDCSPNNYPYITPILYPLYCLISIFLGSQAVFRETHFWSRMTVLLSLGHVDPTQRAASGSRGGQILSQFPSQLVRSCQGAA